MEASKGAEKGHYSFPSPVSTRTFDPDVSESGVLMPLVISITFAKSRPCVTGTNSAPFAEDGSLQSPGTENERCDGNDQRGRRGLRIQNGLPQNAPGKSCPELLSMSTSLSKF
jgi:hypothetical protein